MPRKKPLLPDMRQCRLMLKLMSERPHFGYNHKLRFCRILIWRREQLCDEQKAMILRAWKRWTRAAKAAADL